MLKKSSFRLLILIGGALGMLFLSLLAFASYSLSDVKGPLITLLQEHIDGELKVDSAIVVFFPVGINLKNVRLYAPRRRKTLRDH